MTYLKYLILLTSIIYTYSYVNNYIQISKNLKTNDLSKNYYEEEIPKKVKKYFQDQSLKKKLSNNSEEEKLKKIEKNFEEIPKKIEKYFQEQALNRNIIY